MLQHGSSGSRVQDIQQALKGQKFNPGDIDGLFGAATEAAVIAFQMSEGLTVDGVVGPQTLRALGLEVSDSDKHPVASSLFTVQKVSNIFFDAPLENIKKHLPLVLNALEAKDLADKAMILVALAIIRAETSAFQPIAEPISLFNTSPNGHPYDLYDYRKDLGNQDVGNGDTYKGRGFIQLLGRTNYDKYGWKIGADLISNPESANDPAIAAELLAVFLKEQEKAIREALLAYDLAAVRSLVNGNKHGLEEFTLAYQTGDRLVTGSDTPTAAIQTEPPVMMGFMSTRKRCYGRWCGRSGGSR